MGKHIQSLCFFGLALLTTGLLSVPLRAQSQSSGSAAAASAGNSSDEVSQKIEALQKQLQEVQAELDQMKKQKESQPAQAATAPSVAPNAPAASPSAAAIAPAASPTAPGSSAPSLATALFDSTAISGSVDGYYGYDFNHPADRTASLRAFDNLTNQFSLNLAELIIKRTPDTNTSRLGYNFTLGYGNAMNVVNGSEPVAGPEFDRNVEQAYLSYLIPLGNGLQLDFGKFVTPAGAEVIESSNDWNYSRSVLFTYAIPFFHFGLRAAYVFSPKYTLTGFVLNGWNDVVAPNTGKTYGVSLAWSPTKKVSVTESYLAGPQMLNVNRHWRQLTDTVVQYNLTPKLSLLENFDWGGGDLIPTRINPVFWTGIASYVRYAFNDQYAFTVRY